ncbi:MAG: NifU family protein [Planctomycetota bacterium]|jgi:Fe-S cluster biogenesis protein NfuA|nr:NifU family protein [Planctomycetota bacterium]
MREKIEASIEGIRKMLQGHGGDVQLISLDEEKGLVEVSLQGACVGCPHATETLKMGVEAKLREDVPEIREVRAAAV